MTDKVNIATGNNQSLKTFGVAFFILFIFSLMSFNASAVIYAKHYTDEGYSDKTYMGVDSSVQNMNFAGNITTINYARGITGDMNQIPKSIFLGNDTTAKIFDKINDFSLGVFNSDLSLNQTIATSNINNIILRFSLFNYDGNQYVVIASINNTPDNLKYYTFAFNQSSGLFYLKNSIISNPNYNTGNNHGFGASSETEAFTCSIRTGKCAFIYPSYEGSSAWKNFYASFFSLDDNALNVVSNSSNTQNIQTASQGIYIPSDENIFYNDINNDGQEEFFTPLVEYSTGKFYMDTFRTGYSVSDLIVTASTGARMTNILYGSYNINSADTIAYAYMDGGLETTSTGRGYMGSAYYNGGHWYNFATHSTGKTLSSISNMFDCSVFSNDYSLNYCFVGYDDTENKMYLFGENDFGLGFLQAHPVVLTASNISNYHNYLVSSSNRMRGLKNNRDLIVHAENINNNIGNSPVSAYLSDIVTKYGIYEQGNINYLTGTGNLIKTYSYPYAINYTAVIPMQIKNKFYQDIVMKNSNNLFYIFDGFITPKAYISSYSINPCVSQVWKVNTSASIIVTPRSYNDYYPVKARVVLYYNSIYAQDSGWTDETPSNTLIAFGFIANSTITSGIIRVEVEDNQDSGIASLNIPFSVNINGVLFGDCQTTVSGLTSINITASTPDQLAGNNATASSNSLTKGLRDITALAGIPTDIFLIFLIIIVDLLIIFYSLGAPYLAEHFITMIYAMLFIDLSILIVSAMMGLLSASFIIIMIAIVLIIGAIWLSNMFQKKSGG